MVKVAVARVADMAVATAVAVMVAAARAVVMAVVVMVAAAMAVVRVACEAASWGLVGTWVVAEGPVALRQV